MKPLIVSAAPASTPYSTGTPLHKITIAVIVQIKIVSVNTSKIPKNPCFTGSLVSADACAIDPVPRPASFEKMPREKPFCILINMLPTTPPVTADGANAPSKIDWNTPGTRSILKPMTPIASII